MPAGDAAAPDPASGQHAWQGQHAEDADSARGINSGVKLLLIVGTLSALITLLVALLFYLRPAADGPEFLAIVISEHNYKNMPIRPFVGEDCKLLMDHFPGKHNVVTSKSQGDLRQTLDSLKSRPVAPLVLYVAAPALVRGETVFLLPADAEADNKDSWLEVREVLEKFKEYPEKNKLLILDVAHGLVEPRLGATSDRVAETLQAFLDKQQLSFPVLCSCSAGQTSLTSEVLRSSVFVHYLDMGMRGAADVNQDKRISVKELVDFVKPQVDLWARNNLGVRQQPAFIERGDFVIVPVVPEQSEPPKLAESTPYLKALEEAWKMLDEARNRGVLRHEPRRFLKAEASLLRDEFLMRASIENKDLPSAETRRLLKEIAGHKLESLPRLSSVVRVTGNEVQANMIFQVLRRVQEVKDSQAKEVKETQAKEVKEAQASIEKILKEDKEAGVAQKVRTLVDALNKITMFEREHWKIVKAALGPASVKEPTVETLYVDRLAAFADDRGEIPETFRRAEVIHIWQTMQKHQAALDALAQEPMFLPWVADTIASADETRRKGEARLLWEGPNQPTKSNWDQAITQVQSSGAAYEQARKTLAALRVGNAALERALAELPRYFRWLSTDMDADPHVEKSWLAAAENAALLHAFFTAAPGTADVAQAKLDVLGREVETQLDNLDLAIRNRIKNLETVDAVVAQRQIRNLLLTTRLNAAERARLSNWAAKEARKLHDATQTSNHPALDAVANPMRDKMALALLRLVGIDTKDPPQESPAERDLRVHNLWGTDGLLNDWRKAAKGRRADTLGRLVSPWDTLADEDHGLPWRNSVRDEYLAWLRGVYLSESRDAGPRDRKMDDLSDQAIRDFYREAAQWQVK